MASGKKPSRLEGFWRSLRPSHHPSPSPSIPAAAATTPDRHANTASIVNVHEPVRAATSAPQPATYTTAAPLNVHQATSSSSILTVTNTDSTANLPARLWDQAYDELKKEESGLLDAYEKILSSFGSDVTGSQLNTISQHDPDTRRQQMKRLVDTGLEKITREAKVKQSIGLTMEIVIAARDTISSAIQNIPQAALAWTGVCVALEVSAPSDGRFAY
jgi:hypothetical protein